MVDGTLCVTDTCAWTTAFTANPVTLTATVQCADGVGAASARVTLTPQPSGPALAPQPTDANGVVTWTGLTPGTTYKVQVWATDKRYSTAGPYYVDYGELWWSGTVSVTAGANTATWKRNQPTIKANGISFAPGSIYVGTAVTATVALDGIASKVTFVADLDKAKNSSGAYDWPESTSSTSPFTFKNTVSTQGPHFCAAKVETMVDGTLCVTDTCAWTTAFTAQAQPVLPDLKVTSLTVSSLSANPGDTISVTFTVKNAGTGAAIASKCGIYWGTESPIATSDTLLRATDVPGLSAGGEKKLIASVTIPLDAVRGESYYIGAYADNEKTIAEADETNNSKTKGIFVKAWPLILPTAESGSTISVQVGKYYDFIVVANHSANPEISKGDGLEFYMWRPSGNISHFTDMVLDTMRGDDPSHSVITWGIDSSEAGRWVLRADITASTGEVKSFAWYLMANSN
jgi:hypothetical protein